MEQVCSLSDKARSGIASMLLIRSVWLSNDANFVLCEHFVVRHGVCVCVYVCVHAHTGVLVQLCVCVCMCVCVCVHVRDVIFKLVYKAVL